MPEPASDAADLQRQSSMTLGQAHAINHAAMEAIEFSEWFGQSVLTANAKPGGPPSTFYHGTRREFSADQFQPNADGLIFFASDPRYVTRSIVDPTHIIPVHIRAMNPFRWWEPADLDALDVIDKSLRPRLEFGDWEVIEGMALKIQEAGFDAIALIEFVGEDDDVEFHNIAVFDPAQIRSAIRGVPTNASPRLRFNLP